MTSGRWMQQRERIPGMGTKGPLPHFADEDEDTAGVATVVFPPFILQMRH
jgi:hypothetical protein